MTSRHRSRLIPSAVAAAAAIAVALAGCSGTPAADEPSVLRIGINSDFWASLVSPLEGGNIPYDRLAGRATYESLLMVDPETSEYVGLLATDYVLGEDRRALALTLREDADFSDGTHFDAQALADYCEILFASEGYLASPINVAAFEPALDVTGEYEVTITTTLPIDSVFFENFLEGTPIASPDAAADPESLAESPVGTGPYLMEEDEPEVSRTFVRNPDYRDPEEFPFDRVEVYGFADEIARSNALKAGQIDAALMGGSAVLAELETQGFTVVSSGGTYRGFVIFDFQGDIVPALGDVRVRQAIAMAFDQEAMAEQIERGYATVGDQGFASTDPAYVEGGDDRYPYDPEAAKQLLADAGYADGFAFTIPGSNIGYYPKDFEPIIQQSLADIGITVTFEQLADGAALYGGWLSGAYPVITSNLSYTFTIPSYQGAAPVLGGHFDDDPTFHELTTIMSEGTLDEYNEAADELGEYMLEQSWFIPLAHISASRVVHSAELEVTLPQDRFAIPLSAFQPAD